MPVFTPAPTPTSGGGASFAYDGVTFTVEDSGNGYAVISLQLTSSGDNIAEAVAVRVALIDDDSLGRQVADELYINTESLTQWEKDPATTDYPTLVTAPTNATGYVLLTINNATFGDIDARLAVILPSGSLDISDTYTILGQFAP